MPAKPGGWAGYVLICGATWRRLTGCGKGNAGTMAGIERHAGRLGASYTIVGPLPSAHADMPFVLRVAVRNTGAETWPHRGAHPVTLSYHWLDTRERVVDFEGVRALLPAPLRPGETAELLLQVEPPPRPGEYLLALDMVEEGVNWFSLQGVAPSTIAMTVAPGQDDAPRACIVNGNCVVNDALGNHVLNQLRFFQSRGYRALVLVEHLDERQPPEVARHIVRVSIEDLRAGPVNPQRRRAVELFASADVYVFNYSAYYPLVEAIRLVGHGATIFDYHGVTPPRLWEGDDIEALVEGQRQIQLASYADYAIAHSSFTRDELLRSGAVDAARVYQLPYVVPLERFRPAPREATLAARYGLAAEQPVLLYVGRMAANKRILDLIRALAHIRERLPDTVLLLVGDTSFPPHARVVAQARQLAETLEVVDAVIFAGQVPDNELAAHYQLADIFVTASIHEGFCIPVIEAMACGRPVVGAHATALPETIGPGGLTFTPEDPADLAAKVIALLESRMDERRRADAAQSIGRRG
jgi:glycosyltransferase involved in cell wall biosynthesis